MLLYIIDFVVPAPSYVVVRSDKPDGPIRPVGSNVTLTCMVGLQQSAIGTGVPLMLIVLIMDPTGYALSNTVNLVNGSTYTSRVTISTFGRAQSGVYTCEATLTSLSPYLSESSTATEEIHLRSGIPPPPSELTYPLLLCTQTHQSKLAFWVKNIVIHCSFSPFHLPIFSLLLLAMFHEHTADYWAWEKICRSTHKINGHRHLKIVQLHGMAMHANKAHTCTSLYGAWSPDDMAHI